NSGFVHEQAGSFARRILELDEDERLDAAWRMVYGRTPAADERDEVTAWLVDERNELALSGTGAGGVELAAWTGLARVLVASNEFLYVE
ncbi:MAG: hypothetical protein O7A09_00765, partial [Proteobacteria bacterium]|nr:hypothetical protein [Pseudomonadota bacterium]